MFTTLRAKLFAGYLAILLLAVGLGVYAIISFRSLSSIISSGLELNAESTLANVRMYESLVRINEGALKMLGAESEQGKQALLAEPSTFFEELQNAQRNVASALPEVRSKLSELLTKVEITWQQFAATLPRFIEIAERDNEAARVMYERSIVPQHNGLKSLTFSLFDENVTAFQTVKSTTFDKSRSGSTAIIIVTLSAIGIGFAASYVIARKTTKPLEVLTENVKELQAGRLDLHLPVESADEIGNLSFEFNRLTERLREYEEMNIQQILREKQKSESVISSVNDPLFLFDAELQLMLLNRSAEHLVGLQEATLLGRKIEQVFHDSDLVRVVRDAIDSKVNETALPRIIAIVTEKKRRYFQISSIAIESGGCLLAFSDITHFQELDDMKSEFIAKVSHEFRTPLTSLKIALDLLNRSTTGAMTDDQKELILTSRSDTERLEKLIRDLLAVSKLESGKTATTETSNIDDVFDALIRSIEVQYREKAVRLHAQRSEIGIASISKSDFESLILNLLSNALKYTPKGGGVDVSLERKDNEMTITVRDTGVGIAKDDQSRIFEKFVQLKHVDSATPGSVGLGLAIVKEIAHKYFGSVEVESEVDKGSMFVVKLRIS